MLTVKVIINTRYSNYLYDIAIPRIKLYIKNYFSWTTFVDYDRCLGTTEDRASLSIKLNEYYEIRSVSNLNPYSPSHESKMNENSFLLRKIKGRSKRRIVCMF